MMDTLLILRAVVSARIAFKREFKFQDVIKLWDVSGLYTRPS